MVAYSGVAVAPELEEWEELPLLRSLLEASDYGVLFSNSERRDIICNRRFGELFGVDGTVAVRSSPEEVRAMVLPRLHDPEGFRKKLDIIYANPSLSCEDEIDLSHPHRVLRRYTTPVLDSKGTTIGRLWTFLDITRTRSLERQVEAQAHELRQRAVQLAHALKSTNGRLQKTEAVLERTEGRLVEAEKLSAVGLLAASVAHDIGNILAPLAIEITLADRDEKEERALALSAMSEQVNRLSLLTRRLLSLARDNPLEYAPVDLPSIVERLVNLLSPQAALQGTVIHVRIQKRLPPILGDESQIEQLLVNLAVNSLQAMQSQEQGELKLGVSYRREGVCLKVSDTGPGIPSEARRRLFDAFFSTRPGGTGLGLFSCKQIVERHGGTIHVRSSLIRGTHFLVWLPAYCERQDN